MVIIFCTIYLHYLKAILKLPFIINALNYSVFKYSSLNPQYPQSFLKFFNYNLLTFNRSLLQFAVLLR